MRHIRKALHRKRMAYLRGKLLEKRRELLGVVSRGVTAPREKPSVMPGDDLDIAEESNDTEIHYGIAEIELASLNAVEQALRKLADGTYGLCERCSGRIPASRLKVMPFASLCLKCKEKEEAAAKAGAGMGEGKWSRVETESDESRILDHVIEGISRGD